ncbi:hypothetical protein JW960_18350 [candidate division KSB1 bacterium]|nr:hypothetical protein [candidate division KSB1 bacterium]
MEYSGKYSIFNSNTIKTYPLRTRQNKVKKDQLIFPEQIKQWNLSLSEHITSKINLLAKSVVDCRQTNKPVVLFSGAHLIKSGMGPLIIDLAKHQLLTLVAGNGATAIHDFELALIGETSEYVPDALGKGQFGMAYEFAYINEALSLGNKYKLGYGELLGKMICDAGFRSDILWEVVRDSSPGNFSCREISVLAACYENSVPFTVHAGIGVDVIDQHPSFDGQAKGGCSGRDFLIFTNEICKFTNGGVVINIGSAVQGPEVLLKAISMAANAGNTPHDILTADFDLRNYDSEKMTDESFHGYYFRDQKSIVTRIPLAFNGNGLYIQGDIKQTVPLLYKTIMELI